MPLQAELFARCSNPSRPAHAYKRRQPEETVLYETVQRTLETFLAEARGRDQPLPRFVYREFRTYLRCGILAHGFVRVHCDACGDDRVVAFSCKGRGFCPSCGGRRMSDTAAHLVDRVIPHVPVRQWVLSLPFGLRYRMAFDARLSSAVLNIFLRTLFRSLKRRARKRWNVSKAQCGAITFIQRFGGALNLNVHFHSLVLDGVYPEYEEGGVGRFLPLPPPTDAEVEWVARRVILGIERLLKRRGLGDESEQADVDPLSREEPLLAELYAASVASRVATGERRGQQVLRLGDRIEVDDLLRTTGPRCVRLGGLSLHANVAVPARDRKRLERLCRYVARPPLAKDRLTRGFDGRLLYRLKRPWRDGSTHVVFSPMELLEKLVSLIPKPRAHQVRYHGILGPSAKHRKQVIPKLPALTQAESAAEAATDSELSVDSTGSADTALQPDRMRRRLSWAELLKRVFAIDVLECPKCGERTRIMAVIEEPEVVRSFLACLNLPSRAPPVAPSRRAAVEPTHDEPDSWVDDSNATDNEFEYNQDPPGTLEPWE